MSRRFRVTLAVLVPLSIVTVTLFAGITHAHGTGTQLQANVWGWSPDGAASDTFWDSPVVDVPGFSIYTVHCHGWMRIDLQVGATGPMHSNPCYAAMGAYRGGGAHETYMFFSGGSMALYRDSVNWGPWIYSIGKVTNVTGPPQPPG